MAPPGAASLGFDNLVVRCGSPDEGVPRRHPLASAPLLAALQEAGTEHIYADTADPEELGALLRDWRSLVRTAGCDVFTAPCGVLGEFLGQIEVPAEEISSRLESSNGGRLGIAPEVVDALGSDRIARLYRVEPELTEFAREFRGTREYRELDDGDRLFRCFDEAGFSDLFHAPGHAEREELRGRKFPDLRTPLTRRLPLDTLYSLLANGDFEDNQRAIDQAIADSLRATPA